MPLGYGGWILEESRITIPVFEKSCHWDMGAGFLRNRGLQFLFLRNRSTRIGSSIAEEFAVHNSCFLGNRVTRIGGSILEESRFTIPVFGESCH